MSLTSIRQAIDDILRLVPGVNNVYQFRRWTALRDIEIKYFKNPVIGQDNKFTYQGWMISLSSIDSQFTIYQKKHQSYIFRIEGFLSVSDKVQSSLTFQDLFPSIITAFDDNQTLNDTCETIYPDWGTMSGVPGFQVVNINDGDVGGVFCHFADCRLCAVEKYD